MDTPLYSAFSGSRLLATGPLPVVLAAAYPFRDNSPSPLLIFSHTDGHQADFNWQGTLEEVIARASPAAVRTGPGRPKLGVVSTEVTLLPRHWDWLNSQPARASGTIRRLVDQAMAREAGNEKRRREVLGTILWALAGNEPGFEEASRALYSGNIERLKTLVSAWSGSLGEFVSWWVSGQMAGQE